MLIFQVKITPKNKIKHEIQEDPTAVLVLAPFNKAPNLQFENVKLGTSKVLELIVRNPNDNKIQVCKLAFCYQFINIVNK